VQAALESFAKAFESRDAKVLAAQWTAEGEYQPLERGPVRGREALEKGFTAFFAKTPEVKAKIQSESLRFLGGDLAVDEGSATIQRGPAEPASTVGYRALLVRENGRWQLAQLVEIPGDKPSISDLGWLIGQWKSAGNQGAEIMSTYSWSASKKFIHVQFAIKEKELALGGSQVIGVDPATGGIRSWTFEADGGVGESNWSRDGDHWVIAAEGTLADGSTLGETNILRKINDDTFTWQSTERSHGETSLADLAPVKVTRVKPAP
jgi:uncharacterized protein (TIGR02246 family)